MVTLDDLPASFQNLFGETAERLGKVTGFLKRVRHYNSSQFLTTLVFGYLQDSQTTLDTLASELRITPSALQQRFDQPQTAAFLLEILKQAIATCIHTRPAKLNALKNFKGVFIIDSTTIPLPPVLAHLFAGCGGGNQAPHPAAMLKILVTYEVQSGRLHELTLHPAKDNDNGLPEIEGIPSGSLHLRDMGFYQHARLNNDDEQGKYWISRVPCSTHARLATAPANESRCLAEFLKNRETEAFLDLSVVLGAEGNPVPLTTRLVAWRCREAEAQKRRERLIRQAKKNGKTVSKAVLALCVWMVYITNVPAPQLKPKQIGELYRVRWQIELMFKRWKSVLGLEKPIRKRNEGSSLVEVYAR